MIPGMNQRKMAQVMRRMGIHQTEINAKEVIIKTDDKEIIVANPQVLKVNMMGQQTFQIAGQISERAISSEPDINKEDIQTVVEQANCSEAEAIKAIKEAKGDLAEAILKLKSS